MRKLTREPLSEEAQTLLCKRTACIAEVGSKPTTVAARVRARRAEAKRLWDQERTKAFEEIERKLRRASPGNEFCMYCESGEGSDIDHFWPKKRYPARAYTWENYLWACSVCNSNYKREAFPRDANGAPLLINPLEEDPREHLQLSPRTGKYVSQTEKGRWSIEVFGLNRGRLEKSRQDAWNSVQVHLIFYRSLCARHDTVAALEIQRTLCRHPHASVLLVLLATFDAPGGAALLHRECVAALEAHPEIRSWI